MTTDLLLFAPAAGRAFGERVAASLGAPLAPLEEREFEDGEHKARPLASVRGADVYVVQSLYGEPGRSVDDKLCRLLFVVAALKDAAAARVTAVVPYLCYSRKDRRTQPRDPVTTRYVATLFEAMGVDRVVTLDVHNLAAYQNAFRCPAEHLEARPLFARHFAALLAGEEVVVVSPDVGGAKRAEQFRTSLGALLARPVGSAFVEKHRAGGVVTGEAVVGDVAGKAAVIVDDLISTGGTIARAATSCRTRGAKAVYAAATHGLFTEGAARAIADPALDRLVVTNSVPPFRLDTAALGAKLAVLDVAPLVAEAIRRLHAGGSLVELLELPRPSV